jgi:serine protease Do
MRRQTGFWMAGFAAIALLAPGMGPARAAVGDDGPAWLGVYSQTLTPELREGLGYKGDGALVSRVVPDGPAARAGVRKGDVVVGINSTTITTSTGLARAIRGAGVGQTVAVRVVRAGERRTLSAKLMARPEVDERDSVEPTPPEAPEPMDAPEPPEPPAPGERRFEFDLGRDLEGIGPGLSMLRIGRGRLGVRIESLNLDLGSYFGVKDGKGALVLAVLEDTPAERAGFKAGDVITKVGDKPVRDANDLVSALDAAGKKVALAVFRKGATRTIEAELGEAPHAMRFRGDGPLGMGNGDVRVRVLREPGDQSDVRRQIDELRRELRELRDRLEELQRN